MYHVPNVGPAIYMTQQAEDWAERIGSKVEKASFSDLEKAKAFADRIRSKVEDDSGAVVYDAAAS